MAWIKTIDEDVAAGDVKRVYAEQREHAGELINILDIHGLPPEILKAHLSLYHIVMQTSDDDRLTSRLSTASSISIHTGRRFSPNWRAWCTMMGVCMPLN